ncbi:MAG: EAL domain-containing protein [Gammaproteobacteria bacterium]|nr:EAL domain-containing protein [Gammaproteobacteria bacterium]NIR85310.1 EAL domain-containing protein [Gammaproteobacteria bacterium]NIR88426.1 EAL domain-containing protein [Gammaproteobacteria bacterium]NIU06376.1 EAL domain-containing protein [Gammaproteobacteria bacterium]NIV53275.1 EAL domain-containing protein [Gammaproteobacteria bacterium]
MALARSLFRRTKRPPSDLQVLEALESNSPLAVIEWDRDLRVQRWSPQAEAMFAWRAREVLGQRLHVWRFFHEADADRARKVMLELLQGRTRHSFTHLRNYTKDGRVRSCEWYSSALLAENAERVSILSLVCDVTDVAHHSEELAHHATHDPLTGMVNRREFENRLQSLLQSTRQAAHEHALCYLDLDYFKELNDTCGHLAGDELLRVLGRVLPQGIREQDTLARIGGDEFALLLPECTLEEAQAAAATLRQIIEELRFAWEGKCFRIGASIGVTPVRAHSGNLFDVLHAADAACATAKATGGNRIHVQQEGFQQAGQRRSETGLVSHVREALEEGGFELYFQPIVPVEGAERPDRRYELLLRLQHEGDRPLRPGDFLPAAERYNLAPRIDRWVIDRAFAWLTGHPEHLRELMYCGINLSSQSLTDEYFLDFVIERFQETHVPPEKICFELSETSAASHLSAALHFIETLRGLGCHFALDHFGTGMSSFAHLRRLPVAFLKIEGGFVKRIVHSPIDLATVKSINELAQAMGKQTIAQSVENETVLEALKRQHIGLDFVQGDHLGRPQPLDSMRQLHAVR